MNAYLLRGLIAACCLIGLPAAGAIAADGSATPRSLPTPTITHLPGSTSPCDGSLTPQTVSAIRESFRMDDHARAMYNAVTSADMSLLVLNRNIVRSHNDLFSNKIKTGRSPTRTNPAAAGSSPASTSCGPK